MRFPRLCSGDASGGGFGGCGFGAGELLRQLAQGAAPQVVGKNLAYHFVTSPHQYSKTIHYSEICAWYGALTFMVLTHDDALRDALIKKFEPLLPGGAEAERRPLRHHVDDSDSEWRR